MEKYLDRISVHGWDFIFAIVVNVLVVILVLTKPVDAPRFLVIGVLVFVAIFDGIALWFIPWERGIEMGGKEPAAERNERVQPIAEELVLADGLTHGVPVPLDPIARESDGGNATLIARLERHHVS